MNSSIEPALLGTISDSINELQTRAAYLQDCSATLDPEKKRKLIKSFLIKYEKGYLNAKDLLYHTADLPEDAAEYEDSCISSLTAYSDDAFLFTLPPMRSFRKKEEASGLGNYMWQLVWDLLLDYDKRYGIKNLKNPTVMFVHEISAEDKNKRYVPDPDNLDCSKVLDALHDGGLIKSDSVLAITLIHKGKIAEKSQTQVFVFSENHESDYAFSGERLCIF